MIFSHWSLVLGNPETDGSPANKIVLDVRKRKGLKVQLPDFNDYFISLEKIIGQYEELVVNKIRPTGSGSFRTIVTGLELIDVVRCFFAILFLAFFVALRLPDCPDGGKYVCWLVIDS